MNFGKLVLLRKSKLVKASFIYTVTNFISKAFPFLILPLFTHALSLSDYGSFALYRVTTNFCLPIIGLSLSESIVRYYYEQDKINYDSYVSTVLIIELFTLIIACVLLLFAPQFIIGKLGIGKEVILAAFFVSFFSSINQVERGIFRCENNVKLFSILVIGQSASYFIVIGSLYLCKSLSYHYAVYGEVLVYLVFSGLGFYHIKRRFNLTFRLSREYAKSALAYSLPLVIHSFMAYSFALSDRFIINFQLGKEEVAIYAVSFQIASIIQILAISFNSAWTPWIYESLKNRVSSSRLFKIQGLIGAIFVIIGVLFWIVIYNFLPIFAGNKYNAGLNLLVWFVGSNILQSFYWIYTPILKFFNKNWLLIWSSFPALVFSISFNFWLVPKFGIQAAAIINFISWAIIFGITLYNAVKTQKINLIY